MLVRKGNRWKLYPHKVKGSRFGEAFDEWATPSKEWWEDAASKHDHTEITEFYEVPLTDEQLARFEEIRNMPDDFSNVYTEYVLNGTFPTEDFPNTHPFRTIQVQKENKELKERADLSESAIDFLIMNGGL